MADEDYDYVTESDKVARQKRLADVLRKYQLDQHQQSVQTEGRIVGGRYISSPFQMINQGLVAPGANMRRADQAEGLANQMSGAYQQQVQGAQQSWQQGLPRTVPGHPELPGPQAEGGSPELAERAQQIPDRASVLSATLRGMQIPGNEKEAELWNRGMQEEQTREDRQSEVRSALKMTMAQRAEERRMADQLARDKATDKAFADARDDAERERHNRETEQAARDRNTMLQAINAATNETKLAAAKAKTNDEKKEAAATERELGKLYTRMKPLTPVIGAAKEIQKMIDKYTDESGKTDIPGIGHTGLVPALGLSLAAGAGLIDKETNPNRAKVADLVGSIMRNQAGLSQTIAEAARVMEKTLTSGMYGQAEFLSNWDNLVRAINDDLRLVDDTLGDNTREAFVKNGGSLAPINWDKKPKTTDLDKRLEELRAKKKAAGG